MPEPTIELTDAEIETLAQRLLGGWISLSAARVEQDPIDHCRALARCLGPTIAEIVTTRLTGAKAEVPPQCPEHSPAGFGCMKREGHDGEHISAIGGWWQ